MEKNKDASLTFYNKNYFNIKKYITKTFDLPKYFPYSELGSYRVSIIKN